MFKRLNFKFLLLLLFTLVIIGGCSTSDKESLQGETTSSDETQETKGQLDRLTIQAPLGISITAPIYKLVDDNNLNLYTKKIELSAWKNPDELRARISGKQVDISAVPTYVGANLYNRGMDVKLLNTLVWGILYMIGPSNEEINWESLKGESIYVPFKGDMPDLVFQYLLKKNDIDPAKDIKIEYVSSPQEVVKLLISGKAKYAIVPEHVATLSVLKGNQEGRNLSKVMNLQEEWKKTTGREALIPQAGLLVSNSLIEKNPKLIEEIQKQLDEGIQFINSNPAQAAKIIQKYNEDVPTKLIENVIPYLNLKFVPASEAKDELEFFFQELSILSPEIIGGKLPDESFYYKK